MFDLEPWPWQPEKCWADQQFIEWLDAHDMRGPFVSVFHMGTGLHHNVGMACEERDIACLGLTASSEEQSASSSCSGTYQVFLGDIYRLDLRLLPQFSIMTLFHLGEMPDRFGEVWEHDKAIDALLGRVSKRGNVIFYKRSSAYDRLKAEWLIDRISSGVLKVEEDFKSLLVCRRAK